MTLVCATWMMGRLSVLHVRNAVKYLSASTMTLPVFVPVLSAVLLSFLVWGLRRARRRVEVERRHTERVLRLQEELFHALIENGADGIALISEVGTVLYASSSVERVLGYRSEALLGRHGLGCIHPDDRDRVQEVLKNVLQLAGASVTSEFRCRHRDGTWNWIESTATNFLQEASVGAIVVNFRDIEVRKKSEEQLRALAVTDPLTGLANYRRLIEVLESELKRCERTERSFAVLLLDLDGLKRINDSCGHLVGSRALCWVADVLRDHCRETDTPARYGGDEFAVVLPEANLDVARSVANRIEQNLASDREHPSVSVSIGIAAYPKNGDTIERLLDAADRDLYEVKSVHRDSTAARTALTVPAAH